MRFHPIRAVLAPALTGLLLAGAILAPRAAHAAGTFTVTNTGDDNDGACTIASTGNGCSLREAITAANLASGGTVNFGAGVTGTITLGGSLPNLTTNVTISGPGANVLAVDGASSYAILKVISTSNSTITDLTFQNGRDSSPSNGDFDLGGGGAIYVLDGTLLVDRCNFQNNHTSNDGGAICDYGTVTVNNSSFFGNSARYGGALLVYGNGAHTGGLNLTNCTFQGNSAGAEGGAMEIISTGPVIRSCTITGNSASFGGGIESLNAYSLHNSIVAQNTAPGAHTDLDSVDLTVNNHNFIGGDPKFFAAGPRFNGGTTKTIALLPDSPAINVGDNTAVTQSYDQRGASYTRIVGGTVDIGAFEVQGPYASARDFAFSEGNTTKVVNYTVTLTGPRTGVVNINYATANGTAIAGTDYTATSGTLTFATNESSKLIPVTILGNTTDQDDRSFNINLSQAGAPTAEFTTRSILATIVDDDLAPKISVAPNSVSEGDAGTTNLDFTVSLDAASAKTVTVEVFTDNGAAAPKATPGTDYTTVAPFTLTFNPGDTTKTVSVQVNGDTVAEQNENIRINLRNPVNGYVNTASKTATGTINDDDTPPIPSISINDRSITEGETSRNVTFSVTLSQPTSVPVTVIYDQIPGTATDGADYTLGGGTLTFAPGETTKSITATILGDTIDENDETFAVNLSAPTNATIADGQGVGTIVDNDAAPTLSINNVSQNEGNDGTTAFTFTVTLTGSSERTVSVDAYTAASSAPSATADVDYATVAPATLTFAPGDTTKTVTVYVNGDTAAEANERFAVRLTNAVNATIKTAFGIGTIQNDDAPTFRAPSGRLF